MEVNFTKETLPMLDCFKIVRLTSRVHSFFENPSGHTNKVMATRPEVYQEYIKIKNTLLAALKAEKIITSATPTSYYCLDKTFYRNMIHFYFLPSKLVIPMEIKEVVSKACGQKCSDDVTTILFGFTGRFFDVDFYYRHFDSPYEMRVLVQATHLPDSSDIGIDYASFILYDEQRLAVNIVHELLHDAGFDEIQVHDQCNKVYTAVKDIINVFAHTAFTRLCETFPAFLLALQLVEKKMQFEMGRLELIAYRIYEAGFPYPPEEVLEYTESNSEIGDKRSIVFF